MFVIGVVIIAGRGVLPQRPQHDLHLLTRCFDPSGTYYCLDLDSLHVVVLFEK